MKNVVCEKLKGSFHFGIDVVDYLTALKFAVIDTEGEVGVTEIAPIVGYHNILDIGIREPRSLIVVGAIIPAHINSVVVFSLFLFLPCFERRNRPGLHKGVVAVVLARSVVVFIISGESKEKHTTVFILGVINPRRDKLNLHFVCIFIITDNLTSKEIDRLQTALILEDNTFGKAVILDLFVHF